MKKRRKGAAQTPPYALQLQAMKEQQIGNERQDSAVVICKLAGFTLNEVYGFGFHRINRFMSALMENIRELYADREQKMHWVDDKFRELGFIVTEDGRILCCTDANGKPIKRRDRHEE